MKIKIFFLFLVCSCGFYSSSHTQIIKAQENINKGEYAKAVDIYDELLKKNLPPQLAVKVAFNTANIRFTFLNDHTRAIKDFEKVINYNNYPQWQVKALEKIAEIQFSYLKKFDSAKISYEKLTKFTPKLKGHDFYQKRLALSLINLNKFKEAENELIQLAKESSQEKEEAFLYLGLINFYMKNNLQAKLYWAEFFKISKDEKNIILVKFLIGNSFEMDDMLKESYVSYYQIMNEYDNFEAIKLKLESILKRRVDRKR